jgi:C-terminal processing protease CtpA/Prc
MINSENKLNPWIKFLFLVVFILGLSVSCDDPVPEPEPDPVKQKAPALTIKINQFIQDVMGEVYFWYKTLPDIDVRYEFDSKAYFEKLLYKDDKWSRITDDAKKLEDSYQGKETTYGWSLAFGRFSNTQTIFALVEFVYPDSPADKAGVKRGDIIFQMNGADIMDGNYLDLLNSESRSFTLGQYTSNGISNKTTLNLTALELNLNPVQFTKIIEHGGRKIGYLFYAQFVDNFKPSIDAALQSFIDNKVTDVVLDLRYNPGGYGHIAQYVCSSLAPINVVNEERPVIKNQYNDLIQKYFEEKNMQDRLGFNFLKTVPVKMGLNKLHIITGSGTASASEFVIIGLKPYMNVKTVGEPTYGKFTGMWTLKPEDIYSNPSDYKDFENWAVEPIVMKYANSQGFTDFKDGLTPDIPVEDDLFSPVPLGDKKEIMLKKTIEDITGLPVIAKKSAIVIQDYTIFDRGFSKFDANKRELLIEYPGKDFQR